FVHSSCYLCCLHSFPTRRSSDLWICGPLLFSRIYAPVAIFFLGFSAWFCFRQWKLSAPACLLGGLAAALNSDFFSTACWGVAAQDRKRTRLNSSHLVISSAVCCS